MPAPPSSDAPSLILASTSVYRGELLSRLGLPFATRPPGVDEGALPDETAAELATRLAAAKASTVSAREPGHWVIGSDQVADLAGTSLGKPGSRAAAIAQLTTMSGRIVHFRTALALALDGVVLHQALDTTEVHVRPLSGAEIERYVDREQPYDCAGSFKSEGLGISLFDAVRSDDPSALVGLPLIATARLLRRAGFALP